MKKLIIAFRNFSNTTKNTSIWFMYYHRAQHLQPSLIHIMHFIYQGYTMFHPQTEYWRPSLATIFLFTEASTTISFSPQQFFLIRLHIKTSQQLWQSHQIDIKCWKQTVSAPSWMTLPEVISCNILINMAQHSMCNMTTSTVYMQAEYTLIWCE
jgi:hypothetical protein